MHLILIDFRRTVSPSEDGGEGAQQLRECLSDPILAQLNIAKLCRLYTQSTILGIVRDSGISVIDPSKNTLRELHTRWNQVCGELQGSPRFYPLCTALQDAAKLLRGAGTIVFITAHAGDEAFVDHTGELEKLCSLLNYSLVSLQFLYVSFNDLPVTRKLADLDFENVSVQTTRGARLHYAGISVSAPPPATKGTLVFQIRDSRALTHFIPVELLAYTVDIPGAKLVSICACHNKPTQRCYTRGSKSSSRNYCTVTKKRLQEAKSAVRVDKDSCYAGPPSRLQDIVMRATWSEEQLHSIKALNHSGGEAVLFAISRVRLSSMNTGLFINRPYLMVQRYNDSDSGQQLQWLAQQLLRRKEGLLVIGPDFACIPPDYWRRSLFLLNPDSKGRCIFSLQQVITGDSIPSHDMARYSVADRPVDTQKIAKMGATFEGLRLVDFNPVMHREAIHRQIRMLSQHHQQSTTLRSTQSMGTPHLYTDSRIPLSYSTTTVSRPYSVKSLGVTSESEQSRHERKKSPSAPVPSTITTFSVSGPSGPNRPVNAKISSLPPQVPQQSSQRFTQNFPSRPHRYSRSRQRKF